jgi:hypothetical protein
MALVKVVQQLFVIGHGPQPGPIYFPWLLTTHRYALEKLGMVWHVIPVPYIPFDIIGHAATILYTSLQTRTPCGLCRREFLSIH